MKYPEAHNKIIEQFNSHPTHFAAVNNKKAISDENAILMNPLAE